MKIQKFTSNYL